MTLPGGVTEIECLLSPLTFLQNRKAGKEYEAERFNFETPLNGEDERLCSVVINFHQSVMLIVHPLKKYEFTPELTYLRIPPQWLWALKNVRWPSLPHHRWTGSDQNNPNALISASLVQSFPTRTKLNSELPPPANLFSSFDS